MFITYKILNYLDIFIKTYIKIDNIENKNMVFMR